MRKIPRIKRTRNIRIRTPEYEAKEQEKHKSQAAQRKPIITPDGLFNEVAAAKYIGKSISTLQNWRSMQKGPPEPTYRGRYVFYTQAELDKYLATKKKKSYR